MLFGEMNGSFREMPIRDLGAIAAKEAIKKANVNLEDID